MSRVSGDFDGVANEPVPITLETRAWDAGRISIWAGGASLRIEPAR